MPLTYRRKIDVSSELQSIVWSLYFRQPQRRLTAADGGNGVTPTDASGNSLPRAVSNSAATALAFKHVHCSHGSSRSLVHPLHPSNGHIIHPDHSSSAGPSGPAPQFVSTSSIHLTRFSSSWFIQKRFLVSCSHRASFFIYFIRIVHPLAIPPVSFTLRLSFHPLHPSNKRIVQPRYSSRGLPFTPRLLFHPLHPSIEIHPWERSPR